MNSNAMAGMNPMGGPVGGAPVPMMNNGAVNPQAVPPGAMPRQQQVNDNQRGALNTYIYEYFIRYGMYECARTLLSSDQTVGVHKEGAKAGAVNGAVDDSMDTDNKDDVDSKVPEDLPPPKLPIPASDTSFLYEWFSLFWDIYNAQRQKSGNPHVNQYVSHTQQSRLKQNQQQELLRQMRPDMAQQQYHQMMRMQNGGMGMGVKQGNLARAAMANNQNNPQMQMLQQQQAKQNQMQRDPSSMEGNRDRPSSPASGDNAPSPSKRQRIDNAPFNPNQAGAMMANGRGGPGMPPQQMPGGPSTAAAHQMLANGISPGQLPQFPNFQHHGNQMNNKQIPNAGGPQGQGSPLMQGPDGTTISNYYNPPNGEMGGANGLRGGPGAAQAAGGSNHALQDYQMQLMLLEQQNKKRLMMARQEQDNIGGMPREGQPPGPGAPGVPTGPNGQPFPEASPQAMRSGTSPNPADQMKRGTPQMNNSGIPSPVPEGGQQSRGSPNPGMNFMNNADPNMAPHFFKGGDGSMSAAAAQAQMNGMRPPSSHPGQFNGQMTPQMMRQQQAQQQGGQNGAQWQQGPNGQMVPQGMQQGQQVQGTPQQRAMPPPQAPAAGGNNANNRTTASPQQAAAAPPTPNQTTKAAPKKKETKAQKDKRAANQKKANQNANNANNSNPSATPAESNTETEAPAPATPITPVNPGGFNKGGPNSNAAAATTAAPQTAVPAPQATPVVPPQGQNDPNQNNSISMDNFGGMGFMDMETTLQTGDVLNDFDFDSFLHDGDGDNQPFDFNGAFTNMEGNEIGAE